MFHKLSNQAFPIKLNLLLKDNPEIDHQLITEAFAMCRDKNRALFMAQHILETRLRTNSVLAAILFDVNAVKIQKHFSQEIANLITQTENLVNLPIPANLKKNTEDDVVTMLIAIAQDIRVILLSIVYLLYLLNYNPQHFSAQEVKNILRFFAPLCSRLNLWKLKMELENSALKILEPAKYQEIEAKLEKLKEERKIYLANCIQILTKEFQKIGVKIQVNGRIKHIYSIYKKIELKKIDFEEIYDLIALRIIVPKKDDCYTALGIVHSLWEPHFERIKDYIAVPKPNNYQSLHTTVLGPENHYMEIQIRTQKMDHEANYGIAAHWTYSQNKRSTIQKEAQPRWLKSLLNLQQNSQNEELKDLKIGFFQKEIFVFTDKGEIFNLPKGACAMDLALKLKQEKTDFCEINQVQKSMATILQNGDLVKFN